MKRSVIVLVIMALVLLVTVGGCSPSKENTLSPTINKLLYKEDLRSFRIPGFLVKYAMMISKETRQIRPALRGVSAFTISISENIKDSQSIFKRINNKLIDSNYSSIMEVIDSESSITIKALEQKGIIREMVILVNDDSSIICFALRGRISPNNFIKLVDNLANQKNFI
jgi:hypothetical protein